MANSEKVGHPGKEASAWFLAGPRGRGELFLEIGDAGLGGSERLLHYKSALDKQVRRRRLLRKLCPDVFISLRIFWLCGRRVQPVKEG